MDLITQSQLQPYLGLVLLAQPQPLNGHRSSYKGVNCDLAFSATIIPCYGVTRFLYMFQALQASQ
jgi:hypothetical protein